MSPSVPAPSSVSSWPSTGWIEDFDGTAGTPVDATLFGFQTGGNGWGNKELETYTNSPANASLDGEGDLAITMLRQAHTGTDGIARKYTSARLTTQSHWSFEYGTLSARIKVATGDGVWPAFWLVGDNIDKVGWPACGEIDVVEAVNSANVAYTSVHGPDGSRHGWTVSSNTTSAQGSYGDAFHVYSVERQPGLIVARIDGVIVGSLSRASLKRSQQWVFDEKMFALFNVAVGSVRPVAASAHTPAESSMLIDWIRYEP